MDNNQQYNREKYERYMKTFRDAYEPINDNLLYKKEKKEKKERAKKASKSNENRFVKASASLAMDAYTYSFYHTSTLIIDSAFRDINMHPHPNNFVVKLTEPLKDVAAIRLLRTEYYDPSSNNGYFVINQVKVPLQLYSMESAYLYLNGYSLLEMTNDTTNEVFGRLAVGTESYPAITSDITNDPFVYIFRPQEPKLRRFHVKLMNPDGSLYTTQSARVILTLAVYCQK